MTKRYAIVDADNLVVNIVLADGPFDIDGTWIDLTGVNPQPGPGWTYANGVFTPPPVPTPPVLPPVITKIAMITRFTDPEFVGVLSAAKTDVEVEGWYARFSAASVINLQDPRTIDGMNMLVSKNLLTQARATAILTDPVQPEERP